MKPINAKQNAALRIALKKLAKDVPSDAVEKDLRPLKHVILGLARRLLPATIARLLRDQAIGKSVTAKEVAACIRHWQSPSKRRKAKVLGDGNSNIKPQEPPAAEATPNTPSATGQSDLALAGG